MAVTQDQLDDFHRFASAKLDNVGADLSWEELFILWQSERERDEINAAIREGLDDVEAGRVRPADEVMRELRQKHDIAPE